MFWKWLKTLWRWLWQPAEHAASRPEEKIMCETYDPQELFGRVKAGMAELEWRFGEDAEHLALSMGYGGKNGLYYCVLQVHGEHRALAFYVHVQCRVPEEKRQAVAEFLTRANYAMWLGNFELDFRDGEVRYKTSLDLVDGELTTGMLAALLRSNISTVDRYLPGLMSVLWNDVAPADAIGLVESA